MICEAYPSAGMYIPFGVCDFAVEWWVDFFFGWLQ